MGYADWKNDFTFYKIFANHPDILRDLLHDLLGLKDEQAIADLEYLPRDQAPTLPGGRHAIVDVKCREVSGRIFIVEMQLFPHTAFADRVVYNACRALVSQLAEGEPWRPLADVVAVAICDFAVWPDRKQDRQKEPRVPLVSRWRMTEEESGARGLGQVRYVFLELPKLGDTPPANAKETWAWLFRQATTLKTAPEEVAEPALSSSQRKALGVSNKATWTSAELEAWERARQVVVVEQGMVEYARDEGRAEGLKEGLAEGLKEGEATGIVTGKREMLLRLLELRGIGLTAEQREQIVACTEEDRLDRWIEGILTVSRAEDLGL